MKHLLVFTPYCLSRLPHIRKLQETGVKLVLIGIGKPPTWLETSVSAVIQANLHEPEQFVKELLYHSEASTNVSGILCLSETGIYFCSKVAKLLRLPFASPESVPNARNKWIMREAFAANGIPSVKYALVHNIAEARQHAASIGFPIILKPLIGGAKLFTRRIMDERELLLHFQELLTGGMQVVERDPLSSQTYECGNRPAILLEQLLGGETLFDTALPLPIGEISVEGCVSDQQVYILGMHDKPLPANGPYFEEVVWSTPSRLPKSYASDVCRATRAVVSALGINDSLFHVEFRTTKSGPVVLEAACRMGGGPIYRSLLESSGIDMIEVATAIAMRLPLSRCRLQPIRSRPVITFGLFAEEGQLEEIEGLEVVRSHPNVMDVVVYEPPGTYIFRAPRSKHCTVHVMIAGDSFAEVESIGRWAQSTVRFVSAPSMQSRRVAATSAGRKC